MTDSVVVPVHLTLQIDGGGGYQLQGVQMTYAPNGVNACRASLAVGRNEESDLVDLDISHGALARIWVESTFLPVQFTGAQPGVPFSGGNFGRLLSDRAYILFEGRVDDWGPTTLRSGAFAVEVRLFGRMADIASGTLQTSNIIPKSYLDTKIKYPWGQGVDDNGLIRLSEALGSTGFWPALRESLSRVATTGATVDAALESSVTRTIYDAFGTDINAMAAERLSSIRGELRWRDTVAPSVPAIVAHLNQQLRMNWFYGSFLDSIMAIGEQLMFKLVEYGRPSGNQRPGLAVVPYHPFWSRTDQYAELTPNSWDSFQWAVEGYQNYSGAVLVGSTGNEQSVGANGTGEGIVVGLGRIPSFQYGRVHVGPAPGFMSVMTSAMESGGDDEARSSKAQEYRIQLGEEELAYQLRAAYGDAYARIMALNLNYEGRRCRVTSPCVRTDIGPLSAVAVRFPDIPEVQAGADTGALGVFGSVQAVTISIDATRNFAQTIYDIGYVRSRRQQSEIDDLHSRGLLPHPFFRDNFTLARLDRDPFEAGFF